MDDKSKIFPEIKFFTAGKFFNSAEFFFFQRERKSFVLENFKFLPVQYFLEKNKLVGKNFSGIFRNVNLLNLSWLHRFSFLHGIKNARITVSCKEKNRKIFDYVT